MDKPKTLAVSRSNFRLKNGILVIGKKYRYSEAGRQYIVRLHDAHLNNSIITLTIEVLESSPKPYSMPVGKTLEIGITEEEVFFQGTWYIYDIPQDEDEYSATQPGTPH